MERKFTFTMEDGKNKVVTEGETDSVIVALGPKGGPSVHVDQYVEGANRISVYIDVESPSGDMINLLSLSFEDGQVSVVSRPVANALLEQPLQFRRLT